ncbi:choice-of-anchor P family protein [Haloechinothrix sp. LS1_15]|uniref:choice-of-anchor P family protein n=1 Tax=Haloechinothrix sp. LS1_15 TaxID=2652248 RepID=UPI002946BCAE|nr:choice-of-anchor P family protein [Haloechinothrix sp. LS1_15]MDV6011809.1 hypothetical protein [Haloechinothrix sp. LS1_15]
MFHAKRKRLALAIAVGLVAASLTGMGTETSAVETESDDAERASEHTWSSASIGSVDAVIEGEEVVQDPIAPCVIGEQERDSTSGVTVGRVASYGAGSTLCRWIWDPQEAYGAMATRSFSTRLLREYGGPIIRVSRIDAWCHTWRDGSRGSIQLTGVRGFRVPRDIPPNHSVTIEGRGHDRPVARIVLNEMIVPDPPDGSMTLNAMRIELFPEGGPASGDIVVGTASCDPFP